MQLEEAQQKLNKITLSVMALNCSVGKIYGKIDMPEYINTLANIGDLLETISDDLTEVAGLLVEDGPKRIIKLIEEGYSFE